MNKPFVTLFSLKNVTQSMKMNVKLFTRRDAPLNMNLNAQQVLLTMGVFIRFFLKLTVQSCNEDSSKILREGC